MMLAALTVSAQRYPRNREPVVTPEAAPSRIGAPTSEIVNIQTIMKYIDDVLNCFSIASRGPTAVLKAIAM
eukprot:5076330-Pleurochrysis_carterae.AAC.1